jgi:hypothetical protein
MRFLLPRKNNLKILQKIVPEQRVKNTLVKCKGKRKRGEKMFSKEEVKTLLDELLEEEALLIGGSVALQRIDDGFIWKLMKSLDQIRDRFMAKIENTPDDFPDIDDHLDLTPHPAIEHFLLKLKRSSGNKGAML